MGEGRGDRRSCRECVLGQGEALPLSRWLFKTLGAQAVPSWPQAAPPRKHHLREAWSRGGEHGILSAWPPLAALGPSERSQSP